MKKISHLLILLSILFLSCQETHSNQTNLESKVVSENVTKDVFEKKMKEKTDKVLIDVRTPEEYQKGTIQNAVNINFYDKNFEEQILKLDKSKPIFLFCKSGGRSSKTLNKMKGLEFKEVYELIGGYDEWKSE